MVYRREIEGLRAIAVAAVLANHFFASYFPNGYLGVDIFFVISGFVIAGSISSRYHGKLGSFLLEFYARRFKRLLPALVVCVAVTSVLISMVHPFPAEYLRTGVFALFGLSNIYLYLRTTDYFGDAASLNPFTHTWSLGVEEQFYFFFPLLMWLGFARARRRILVLGGLALALLSFVAWWGLSTEGNMLPFYLAPFRVWQFGLGVFIYLLQARTERFGPRTPLLKAGLLLGAVIVAFAPFETDLRVGTVLVSVATASVLFLVRPEGVALAPLQARVPAYIGKVSYSLYLWHWPVVVLLKMTVGLSGMTAAFGVLLSIGLAHMSYRFIERPLRGARWGRKPLLEVAVGVSALGLATGFLLFNERVLRPQVFLGQTATLEAVGVRSLKHPYVSASGALWSGEGCVLSDNDQVERQVDPETCVIGQRLGQADRRVLVVGNSFSAALVEAFDGLDDAAHGDAAFILTASWAAPPVPEIGFHGNWARANAAYWEDVIPSLIETLRPGDQVLILSDLASFSPVEVTDHSRARLSALDAGLRRTSADLAEKGIGLSILGPLPFARDAECTPDMAMPQWYLVGSELCRFFSREETLARHTSLHDVLSALEEERVLTVLNLFDVFCPGATCTYQSAAGEMLYRDMFSHASVEASRLARPHVKSWLSALEGSGDLTRELAMRSK